MTATTAKPKKKVVKSRGVFEKEPGTGVWWIRYFADGQKKREKVGRKSDAIDLYRVRKAAILTGTKMPANMRHKGETLGAVIDRALVWYESHKPKQLYDAKIHLEAIKADLGKRIATSITPADIDDWLTENEDENEWSPATVNRYKTSLSRALQLALVSGHVTVNAARLVPARTENNKRVRWLKEDEEIKLRAVMSPELTEMVEFAIHVGARKSEQFALTWNHVDFKRKEIKLVKTKTGGDRMVPMSATCYQLLKKLHARRPLDNDFVFQSVRYDAPMKDPKKAFETAVKDAGIKDFHWHDLRHSFASKLVTRGVDLYSVSKLLGHATTVTTQRYAHLAQEHLAKAVQALDD